ncbi:MAG: hypothetical protein H6898_09285 [Rhodobacter sp.]|nr:hypothetical protein [Paracoccaceae bacterium]MCC0076763.1 hypothetical protein [Rhodobacter sp.]
MTGADSWAALVGSRLCHDLVSPLGAIGNGVELLQMVQSPGPEIALIDQAVQAAQARLRLYRLAFGAASAGQTVPPRDLTDALTALAERIAVHATLPNQIDRPLARRLMLAVLCAESALAWGGALTLTDAGLTAEAPRLRLDPGLWPALAQGQPPQSPAPATVHFALLAAAGPVRVETGETRLAISL